MRRYLKRQKQGNVMKECIIGIEGRAGQDGLPWSRGGSLDIVLTVCLISVVLTHLSVLVSHGLTPGDN